METALHRMEVTNLIKNKTARAEDVAQLEACLPTLLSASGSAPSMAEQEGRNPNTWKVKAGIKRSQLSSAP